jgi:hypothetical protein
MLISLQIWSVVAMFVGPIVAVLITIWYQKRSDQLHVKYRLFITLMANRKSLPASRDWIDALNTIDVVFEDCPKVITLWHEYFALLQTKPPNIQAWEHKKVQLLSTMGESLGYKTLQQVDIDKFYSPISHEEQLAKNDKLFTELLRVLENTGSFVVKKRSSKASAPQTKK